MIYTVTGFYGTGSSAVTDVIKECKNVTCYEDYEIRFLHDPDGISDLEYNLVENPNRHNSSHAIKRFINAMDMLDHVYFIKRYSKHVGNDFKKYTDEFVKDITIMKYRSYWHFDVYEKGRMFYFLDSIYRNLVWTFHNRLHTPIHKYTLLPKDESAILGVTNEDEFLHAVHKYVYNVINMVNKDHNPDVFLDQLVPPSNIKRYARYFKPNDMKAIIVDRDPRDIYLSEKIVWKGGVAPTETVEQFITWYLWTRNTMEKCDDQLTHFVQFEDLIYKYDNTVKNILDFYGIAENRHTEIKKYFNPDISVNNTQLWNKYPEYEEDIKKIEKELSKYCYNFPKEYNGKKKNVRSF